MGGHRPKSPTPAPQRCHTPSKVGRTPSTIPSASIAVTTFTPAGTIFHKSRTNLTKWFFAMYLMTSTRHGVAAKEIARQLGVTYKCAWRICHELRKLMASADYGGPLGGPGKHVEIDETVMGGYQSNRKRRSKGSNKSLVFGMVERGGKLRA